MKDKRLLQRVWLEPEGTSFIMLKRDPSFDPRNYPDSFELLMHDCNRQIHWFFEKNAKGRKRLAKIKAVIEECERLLNE